MHKISTRLNSLYGRKKSKTRKYFSSFSIFILLKSILLSSFCRKIFENRHSSSFPVFPARVDTLEVLNKQKSVGNNNRFVFKITYHPVLLELKNVLSEIHLLLTPDREHGKVFERIPIVGFRRGKRLKGILVRAKVASL